jgi:hypothetical protein
MFLNAADPAAVDHMHDSHFAIPLRIRLRKARAVPAFVASLSAHGTMQARARYAPVRDNRW